MEMGIQPLYGRSEALPGLHGLLFRLLDRSFSETIRTQLLIKRIATMMAMMTIRTTRTMSR